MSTHIIQLDLVTPFPVCECIGVAKGQEPVSQCAFSNKPTYMIMYLYKSRLIGGVLEIFRSRVVVDGTTISQN